MAFIGKEELKNTLDTIAEWIDVCPQTGLVHGDADECDTTARLVVQRVAARCREAWPHGSAQFLELVASAAVSVLTRQRTTYDDSRLPEILKRLAHESDFTPRHDFPSNPKISERQADVRGAIRYMAGLFEKRDAVNRRLSQADRRKL